MSAEDEPKETNPLIRRVDALMRRSKEAAQEEVPVLTEVADLAAPAAAAEPEVNEEALAGHLERALIARLAPEFDRRLTTLRADLEKEWRRAVRQAVAQALAECQAKPPKE
jgi:hypothetical protein